MRRKIIFPALTTLVLGLLNFYFSLPVMNLRSSSFWGFLIFLTIIFIISRILFKNIKKGFFFNLINSANKKGGEFNKVIEINRLSKTVTRIIMISVIVLLVGGLALYVTSSKFVNSKKYQTMLTVAQADFKQDISEIPMKQIPIVDRDTASNLGKRKLGEIVDLVSQFKVSELYTQINIKQTPYRVSPLEYDGFLKWLSNHDAGIPYYVKIDMATQETDLVELAAGMKYSPSEYFGRNIERHLRFNYPTKMIDKVDFEVDDNGHPYWIASVYEYTIGLLGGKDITGIILVDAVTGDSQYCKVGDVPKWIDRVYSADMLVEQVDFWGAYKSGYWNSLFVQKGVVTATEGYNYLAIDDDVWMYTGITSVTSDESNVGFLLVNMRTKEAKNYQINGAKEYSAMDSAKGKVQEKNYTATFPILVNVANRPTYLVSLKDEAGLVKSFAFVDIAKYQNVAVGATIAEAKNEYLRMVENETEESTEKPEETEITGSISELASAVVSGNSYYYFKIKGDDTLFVADINISKNLPLLKVGDKVKVSFNKSEEYNEVTTMQGRAG